MSAHITTISEPTMTSLQIAEVVEKRHDNVKRTIETLVEREVIVRPQFEDEQHTDSMGRQRTTSVYHVGKRDSYVVVAQLSPEFTARLVDRWQELEQQQATPALPDFNDPAVAARAWADQVEQVQQTRKELTQVRDELGAAREKVETYGDALNRIAKSGETFPITAAAKLLKMKPGKLFEWMATNLWIYRGRSDGPWKAYQDKIDGGLMWVSIFQPDKGDGAFKVHQQSRVTGKGLIYLAHLLNVEGVEGLNPPEGEATQPELPGTQQHEAAKLNMTFRFWVDTQSVGRGPLADLFGISRTHLIHLYQGERNPSHALMSIIQHRTKGAVPVESWFSDTSEDCIFEPAGVSSGRFH